MRSVKAARGSRRTKPKARSRARAPARAPAERFVWMRRSSNRNGFFARAVRFVGRVVVPRRPMLYLTVFLLSASAVAALFVGGYVSARIRSGAAAVDAALADAGFGIAAVRLSGNDRTQASAIISALGFEPGQSIFGADIQTARMRLLALPWVADADVRRQYPDSISVAIIEKLPFALWQTADGLFVIERSGGVIEKTIPADYPHLPLFLGAGAPAACAELVDQIALHRAVSARLKATERVSDRRWNLLLDDGVVVELPEMGWAKELGELEHLIVDKGILERDITEIDLRSPDNYFIQLRNGDKQQTGRGNSA
jgi:cell division protein FtsQ